MPISASPPGVAKAVLYLGQHIGHAPAFRRRLRLPVAFSRRHRNPLATTPQAELLHKQLAGGAHVRLARLGQDRSDTRQLPDRLSHDASWTPPRNIASMPLGGGWCRSRGRTGFGRQRCATRKPSRAFSVSPRSMPAKACSSVTTVASLRACVLDLVQRGNSPVALPAHPRGDAVYGAQDSAHSRTACRSYRRHRARQGRSAWGSRGTEAPGQHVARNWAWSGRGRWAQAMEQEP